MKEFLTVPDEVIDVANAVYDYYGSQGYRRSVEKHELAQPECPTITAKLKGETDLILVTPSLDEKDIRKWQAYGKSMNKPTKITFACPKSALTLDSITSAKASRVGLLAVDENNDIESLAQAHDLTFNVEVPDISGDNLRVRKALSQSYKKFNHGEWRDGHEEACIALEQEARRYFIRAVRANRLVTLKANGVVNTPTITRIKKMTIGELYTKFQNATPVNSTDSRLVSTLEIINSGRIGVAHKRYQNEAYWRKKVGPDLHAIVNCLRILY